MKEGTPVTSATALAFGITRDVLPAASTITTVGFTVAQKTINFGFSLGTSVLRVASNVGLVATVGLAAGGVASPVIVGAAVGTVVLKGLQYGMQGKV
jgi:hypothetical protein